MKERYPFNTRYNTKKEDLTAYSQQQVLYSKVVTIVTGLRIRWSLLSIFFITILAYFQKSEDIDEEI